MRAIRAGEQTLAQGTREFSLTAERDHRMFAAREARGSAVTAGADLAKAPARGQGASVLDDLLTTGAVLEGLGHRLIPCHCREMPDFPARSTNF